MAAEECMLEGLSRTESHKEDVCIIDVEKVKGVAAGENGYKLASLDAAKKDNDYTACKVFKSFDENTPNVEWALRYARAGYKVLPLFYIMPDGYCSCLGTGMKHDGQTNCDHPGKHPQNLVHRRGVQDATTDEKKIRASWRVMPESNIGIKCDKFYVLDIDGIKGRDSLIKIDKNSEIVAQDGTITTKGPFAKTGRAEYGYHVCFKPPEGLDLPGTIGFLSGLDLRTKSNYIVVEPSNHISGNKYKWINSPFDCELPEMPKFLLDAIKKKAKKIIEEKFSSSDKIEVGERNSTLLSFAGLLRHKGLEFIEIRDTLNSINKNRCYTPLEDREIETIAQSVCKYKKDHKVTDGVKKNPVTTLIGAIEKLIKEEKEARLIFDPLGRPFLWVKVGNHFEMVELNDENKAFRKFCFRLMQSQHGMTMKNDETFKRASLAIEVKAEELTEGKGFDLNSPVGYRRIWHNNSAWYDLCNKDWTGIQIDENGYRKASLPPIFLRRGSESPQVEPIYDAKPEEIDRIFKYVHVIGEDKRLLLKAWICASIVPMFKGISLPQPILSLGGVTGSGKTVAAKFIKKIVDPSGVEVRRLPNDVDDLGVMLNRNGMIVFDNIGTNISEDISDTLCIATTKGHDTKRKLYTDDEEAILRLDSSIIITSIFINKLKDDIVNRSIFIETEKFGITQKRERELNLKKEFDGDLPFILGGIFSSISKVFQQDEIDIGDEDPRMLDFAFFGELLSRVWGNNPMKFFSIYNRMQGDKISEEIQENPTLNTLASYIKVKGSYYGPLGDLLEDLKRYYMSTGMGENTQYFASNSTTFSKKLKEKDNALSSMGIKVVPDTKQTNGKVFWKIDYTNSTQTNQEGW